MLIYLADLYHSNGKVNSPTPTNVGFVAAYCKKIFSDSVEIRLFKDPRKLLDELDSNPPDILGLSNYMWNERLNYYVTEFAKKKNRDMVVVVGGPNIRIDKKSVGKFLQKYSLYDYYILFGAEIPFSNLVKSIIDKKSKIKEKEEIEGCFFIKEKEIIGESYISNEKNLDYIPSPFLSGLMDEFLNDGYYPLFETNRGCPFSCTFCVWGIAALGKIKTFSMERVREEMLYVANNFPRASQWILADANFGIMPRDVEIATLIKEMHVETKAFDRVNIWWTKNVNERTYKIAKILGKLCQAYVAFQSLDPKVLKLIRRSNISVDKLAEFKNEVSEYTNGTYTDILLGLPGETMQSHVNSYFGAMKLGFDQIGGGEVRLLPGSEMDEDKYRDEFCLQTKFRVSEGDIGVYSGNVVFELEEVIRSTKWITEDEMLSLRTIRALVYGCTTMGELSPIIASMVRLDINIFEVFKTLLENRKKNTEFSNIIEKLDELGKSEWFKSADKALIHYQDAIKKNSIDEIMPVKLNFWLLGKLILNSNAYNQFLEEFKKALIACDYPLSEQIIDDLIYISSKRNYIRSAINGDVKLKKSFRLNQISLQELEKCGVISKKEINNEVYLEMNNSIANSISQRIQKTKKLSIYDISLLLQDFSIDMQMKISAINTQQRSV